MFERNERVRVVDGASKHAGTTGVIIFEPRFVDTVEEVEKLRADLESQQGPDRVWMVGVESEVEPSGFAPVIHVRQADLISLDR